MAGNEWISVKDRLPPEEINVVVRIVNNEITHWMPIPELPESEDDAE